ncbi:hypothetical protein RF55_7195 [Lasius niger]|uniref:Uncharacterized protein n=1 Tax=Lasius niger TaxID=67767 RepID=A0A0J7KR55_LASNI|nr:hypothetical protein RF55_7195 [Lasius niger]
MAMEKEKDEMVPPQGIRTPSGRRESPTVPGAFPSLSSVGPALSSPTGEGRELATVEELDPKDPLDLTFVDCASMMEDEPQAPSQVPLPSRTQDNLAVTSTHSGNTRSSKRKVKKTSPDAITPSSEETTTVTGKVPRVILRKVKERSRKRKPRIVEEDLDAALGETSSTKIGKDSEVEYTGTEYLDPEYTKKLRSSGKIIEQVPADKSTGSSVEEPIRKKTNRRKKKDSLRVWSSAEDGEDDDMDFCPEDLKIMGATAIGAIGIDCLKTTETERKIALT